MIFFRQYGTQIKNCKKIMKLCMNFAQNLAELAGSCAKCNKVGPDTIKCIDVG